MLTDKISYGVNKMPISLKASSKINTLVDVLQETSLFINKIIPTAKLNSFEYAIERLKNSPSSQELENITRILIRAYIGGQGSLYDFPTKTSREAKTLKELIDKICGICHDIQDIYGWKRGY